MAELAALAAEVPDSGGVVLVPAFTGLGAPHWDREVLVALSGMTTSTSPLTLAGAAFDAVAQQICDVVEEIDRRPADRGPPGRRRGHGVVAADADPGRPAGPAGDVADVAEVSPSARPGWAALGWASVPPVAATMSFGAALAEPDRRARREQWRQEVSRVPSSP